VVKDLGERLEKIRSKLHRAIEKTKEVEVRNSI
jgi:hypothetical protein